MDETLVMYGGEIKDLGNGKVGGYLVLFGNEKKTDLTGDFFTADTDFGPHASSLVFYHHGIDGTIKRRVLDDAAELKKDDVGIWVSAQLTLRDEYDKAIVGLVKSKKLGWSSGTAAHLVEREQVGSAFKITKWPLGLDASLTPTPAEARTAAIPLKSLADEYKGLPYIDADMTMAAVNVLADALRYQLWDAVWQDDKPLKERMNNLTTAFDDCRDAAVRVIRAILTSAPKDAKSAQEELISNFRSSVLTAQDFDDHSDMVLTALKEYSARAKSLVDRRTRDGRIISDDRQETLKALRDDLDALLAACKTKADPEVMRRIRMSLLTWEGNSLLSGASA